jgi:hypothetical protein
MVIAIVLSGVFQWLVGSRLGDESADTVHGEWTCITSDQD